MATMHRHHFNVVGAGPFPIDMLRHDVCSPEHSADADMIRESLDATVADGPRTIHLIRYAPKGWTPTEGRWRSFGWLVVDGTLRMERVP